MNYKITFGRHDLPLRLCLALFLCGLSVAQAQESAGTIKTLQGEVNITRQGKKLPATVGMNVMPGDRIAAGANSSAGVMLRDDTRFAVGPNSQLALTSYAFNPNTNEGNLIIDILKGTLGMISGLIVKANPNAAVLKTPTSTIGIRGTEFVIEVPESAVNNE
jgi:hypothetical protein